MRSFSLLQAFLEEASLLGVPCLSCIGCRGCLLSTATRHADLLQGKSCVVLGDSNIVGTPVAAMLRDQGAASVTVCHRVSYQE